MSRFRSGRLILKLARGASRPVAHLHVERGARQRYGFDPEAFTVGGRLLVVDFGEAERLTAAMNRAQREGRREGPLLAPGELAAAALLHELAHSLLGLFDWQETAVEAVVAALGQSATDRLLTRLRERFPPPRGAGDAAAVVSASTTVEELLLLGEAGSNRALDPLVELFALGPLAADAALDVAIAQIREVLRGVEVELGQDVAQTGAAHPAADSLGLQGRSRAAAGADADTGVVDLLTLLRAPARRHPGSLEGQLAAAVSLWAPLLGPRFARLLERALRGVDLLGEERSFVPPGPPGPPARAEFAPLPDDDLPAAYSRDSDWMAGVVLVAKNAFVWLEQLSRRYQRQIERLDQVPDEALAELAEQGFNTVWLVGVWQRSEASKTIKRLRGQPFAEASAYAIYDYQVAAELGGEEALAAFASRAGGYGLRLAGDMVPNHTGIDARWVEERPDWYLRTSAPPFSSYRFSGPDLTPGRSIEVRIEDGYYDGSDAAVVFERRERSSGEVAYLYHGNDGTAMPWNDTAQLDYLNPEVRAAVIETIVAVAARFKVIRFDAAMTLVKRHVRRLWHPPPGEGGAIPSRSRHALAAHDFDLALPHEFWREVVDTLARRAPDTLLVAEAFWLLESYFVRSLGMHRVYNSAFMHLLAAERNAEHRHLLNQTLQRHPGDLERFVNYLTTPDEVSAAEGFGRGDKYFAAALMLATFPGTPLFGHGQVDGLGEQYGMEFRAPRLDERPDEALRDRHRRVVAPLLRRRAEYASTSGFRLADVLGAGDVVLEDVYAYLFAPGPQRHHATLVVLNNSPRPQHGRLLVSGAAGDAGSDLPTALGYPNSRWLRYLVHDWREGAAADTRFWSCAQLREQGLTITLEPYQALALLDIAPATDEEATGAAPTAVAEAPTVRGPRSGRRRRAQAAVLATSARYAGRARAARRRRR